MRNREERRRQWQQLIEAQARSDTTIKAFCEKHGVTDAQFYWWRRELKRDGNGSAQADAKQAGQFIEVVSGTSAPAIWSGVEIDCGSRGVVRLARGFDRDVLQTALDVLAGAGQ